MEVKAAYIGGQLKRPLLHCWSVQMCPLDWWLVEKVPPYIDQNGLYVSVVRVRRAPYFGGQGRSLPLHWWSVEKCPLEGAPYIGGH